MDIWISAHPDVFSGQWISPHPDAAAVAFVCHSLKSVNWLFWQLRQIFRESNNVLVNQALVASCPLIARCAINPRDSWPAKLTKPRSELRPDCSSWRIWLGFWYLDIFEYSNVQMDGWGIFECLKTVSSKPYWQGKSRCRRRWHCWYVECVLFLMYL